MIEKLITKELLYALLSTILVFSIFNRFNFVVIPPTKEEMTNVEYNYDDEFNTNF
jgi:hypothetical protein